MPKERICGVTSSNDYELLLVFCFVTVILFCSPFVSSLVLQASCNLIRASKDCQKLQYREKSSSKQIKNKHSQETFPNSQGKTCEINGISLDFHWNIPFWENATIPIPGTGKTQNIPSNGIFQTRVIPSSGILLHQIIPMV